MVTAPTRNCSLTHTGRHASKSKKRDPNVLCVDDDDDLTRIVKARLQQHKVLVTRAANGRDGLKLARGRRPSAIVTDLGMARGDGEYLFRRLKSRPSTASIPVIVVSGIDDSQRLAQIHALGAVAILRKPLHFEELFRVLEPYLIADIVDPVDELFSDDDSSANSQGWLPNSKRRIRVDSVHEGLISHSHISRHGGFREE